jgi:hypothetical protein
LLLRRNSCEKISKGYERKRFQKRTIVEVQHYSDGKEKYRI